MGYVYPSPTIYAYFALSARNKRTVESTRRLSVRSYVNLSSDWTILFQLGSRIRFFMFQ